MLDMTQNRQRQEKRYSFQIAMLAIAANMIDPNQAVEWIMAGWDGKPRMDPDTLLWRILAGIADEDVNDIDSSRNWDQEA